MFGRKKHTHEELIYTDPLTGEKPISAKGRGFTTLAAALAAISLVLLVLATLYFSVQGRGQRYQTALLLLEQKDYTAAAAELEALGDFRDSRKLLVYTNALALMARAEAGTAQLQSRSLPVMDHRELAELWEEAAGMLESLGDFADAQARAAECRRAAAQLDQ